MSFKQISIEQLGLPRNDVQVLTSSREIAEFFEETLIVAEKNLRQISDQGQLEIAVNQVIKQNPKVVAQYKKGKKNSIQFLIGQVMKETRGAADPEVVRKILENRLKI